MAEGVLGEIVARKREDVAARLGNAGAAEILGPAPPSTRSLRAALARPGARFVMEVKRHSPSQGRLRSDADPAAVARAYRGAADAISVLTDGPYFGGSLADLEAVRAEFDGPILAKDFVVDPRQVAEARRHGADAVLVLLSVLDDDEARTVMAEAARLGMDILVEAHCEREVRRAVALDAAIIGINNRDLRTMRVDLATTERLAGLVPDDRLLVAESGIDGRADVERLAAYADAFLVGSSLMRSTDVAAAARALAFGRVKICGLTNAGDVAASTRAGACFAGLVMVPGTPRAIDLATAEAIVAAGGACDFVGVFRNADVGDVATAADALGLHAVQLHGAEDPDYIAALRAMLAGGVEIWAACAVGAGLAAARSGADRTLFDTEYGGQSGGSGRSFDWERLAGRDDLQRGVLAGGIGPANARAAAGVGAFAIDVGSGVELKPGRKDPARLAALFDALRVPAREERRRAPAQGDLACA